MLRSLKTADSGFTLIELLIVIVIIGISVSIAIPQFSTFSQKATLRATARELYGQFQRAKMEAIKRNETVAIVFSTSGQSSYSIFADTTRNGRCDSDEDLLAEITLPQGIVFDKISFPDGATSFTSRGRPGGNFGGVDVKDYRSGKTIRLTTTLAGYVHLANK